MSAALTPKRLLLTIGTLAAAGLSVVGVAGAFHGQPFNTGWSGLIAKPMQCTQPSVGRCPIHFIVDVKGGHQVVDTLNAFVSGKCADGSVDHNGFNGAFEQFPIRHKRFKFHIFNAPNITADGKGKFASPRKAQGTLQVHWTNAAGSACDTGVVNWRAKAG